MIKEEIITTLEKKTGKSVELIPESEYVSIDAKSISVSFLVGDNIIYRLTKGDVMFQEIVQNLIPIHNLLQQNPGKKFYIIINLNLNHHLSFNSKRYLINWYKEHFTQLELVIFESIDWKVEITIKSAKLMLHFIDNVKVSKTLDESLAIIEKYNFKNNLKLNINSKDFNVKNNSFIIDQKKINIKIENFDKNIYKFSIKGKLDKKSFSEIDKFAKIIKENSGNDKYYFFGSSEHLTGISFLSILNISKKILVWKKFGGFYIIEKKPKFEKFFIFLNNNVIKLNLQFFYTEKEAIESIRKNIIDKQNLGEKRLFQDDLKSDNFIEYKNSKLKIFKDKEWNFIYNDIVTEERFLIEKDIIIRKSKINPSKMDVISRNANFEIFMENNFHEINENYFELYDLEWLESTSFAARKEFSLWMLYHLYKCNLIVFYNASKLLEMQIRFGRNLFDKAKKKIFIADSLEDALDYVFYFKKDGKIPPGDNNFSDGHREILNSEGNSSLIKDELILLEEKHKKRIDDVFTIISKITWDVKLNIEIENIPEDDIFYNVYQSLSLLKNDFSEIVENNKIEARRAKESEKLKSAFLSNMSHEIRTPMNAIVGFIDLIREEPGLSDKIKKYLKIIENNGKILTHLIDDILDISKIESGLLKIQKESLNIDGFIENIYTQFNHDIKIKKEDEIEFILNVNNGVEIGWVLVDPLRIRQIITNLLSNAVKFTEEGRISLTVEKESGFLRFYISDTGVGLTENQQKKIFMRFEQADNTIQQNYGGTGLGLSISKGLVYLMGGEISVKSIYKEGSEFCFSIPYEKSEDMVAESKNCKVVFNKKNIDCKILIVEDNKVNMLLLSTILSKENFMILKAENGKDAISLCKEDKTIQLVLMDIILPDLDGFETASIISKLRPDIFIIFQSANAMNDEKQKVKKLGIEHYITKPIDKKKLLNAIKASGKFN